MSVKGKTVTEHKILTGSPKKVSVTYITPDSSTSPRKTSSNSTSCCESFNSVHSSENTPNSNMTTVAELAQLVAELKAQVGSSKTVSTASPTAPLAKEPSGLNFKEVKDAMGMFPSKFTNTPPQNATDHMAQFELWCAATNNHTDDLKVRWFCFSILGEVAQWYQQTDFYSFADLKVKFIKNFGKYRSTDDARIAFQSISLGPSEKASDYVRRIRNLAILALMTEADVKDQFFRGLPSKHNCVKQVRNLYNFEQAESYLQNILDLTPEDKNVSFEEDDIMAAMKEHRRSRSSIKKPYKKEEKYQSKSSQENYKSKSSHYPSRSSSGNSSQSRSRSQSRGRRPSTPHESECFNCGGRGHFANVCPTEKGNTSRSNDKRPKSTKRPQRSYSVHEEEPESQENDARVSELRDNTTFKKVLDVFGKSVIIPMPDSKPNLN